MLSETIDRLLELSTKTAKDYASELQQAAALEEFMTGMFENAQQILAAAKLSEARARVCEAAKAYRDALSEEAWNKLDAALAALPPARESKT